MGETHTDSGRDGSHDALRVLEPDTLQHMADQTAPASAGDPLVAGSVGEWLRQSRATTRRSLIPLVVIQLLVFVPAAAVAAATGTLGHFPDSSPAPRFGFAYPLQLDSGPYQVVAALLGAVGLAASVFVIVRDAAGRPWTVREVLVHLARRALPLIGWLVVAAICTAIGYLLLVVPGIYLSIVFTATLLGVVTIERGGLSRTFSLVNPQFLGVLGRLLLLLLISVAYGLGTVVVGGGIGWGAYPGDGRMVVSQLVVGLLTIPLISFWIAATTTLYAHLRAAHRPGISTPDLADELDATHGPGRSG
ncbi:DedA protein [Pseudonocardia sp. Ae707_Ps1]|nr:DedA protein [Pseudonocardia sp. Ae707_Ps1]